MSGSEYIEIGESGMQLIGGKAFIDGKPVTHDELREALEDLENQDAKESEDEDDNDE